MKHKNWKLCQYNFQLEVLLREFKLLNGAIYGLLYVIQIHIQVPIFEH